MLMTFMDQISGVLQQYAHGTAVSREQARRDYDQIAQTVPPQVLAPVIGPALSSLGGQQVEERVRNSASEMSESVRGQFVQQLLSAVSGAGLNLPSLLNQLGISPVVARQPQRATPDEVGKLAAHVQQTRPDVFNQAMAFFKDHPALVKVLGALAVAKIAQHLARQGH
jgi:hypothetical protein